MDNQNIAKKLADVINILSEMHFKGSDCPNVVNIYGILGGAIKDLTTVENEEKKG